MKAIILAAGRGSRLGEYGRDRPKCQVELAGMTLIDRQLATLRGCGISDIVLVTGYQSEMLSLPGVRTVHNPDWAETNMVETLFRAAPLFGDDVIVAYADIVYEPPVLRSILDSRHEISVVIDLSWPTGKCGLAIRWRMLNRSEWRTTAPSSKSATSPEAWMKSRGNISGSCGFAEPA